MAAIGTVDTKPIRVDYMNGDYSKAYDIITEAGIKITYKSVAGVEPHHAAIFLATLEDRDKATKLLDDAGIKWYKPTPFY